MKRLILKKRKRTFFLKKCDHPPYTENRRPRVGLAGYGSAVLATTDGQTKGRCPTDTERKKQNVRKYLSPLCCTAHTFLWFVRMSE